MHSKIKLGVDLSSLVQPLTGIGFYTRKMLESLKPAETSIVGFLPKPLATVSLPFPVKFPPSAIQNIPLWPHLWRTFFLSKQLQKTDLDVFWSPRHILPYSKIPGIPYVLTIHDLVWKICPQTMDKRNYYHEKLLMPHSVKNADAIICVSQTTKQDLMHFLKVPENKIYVTYLAPVHMINSSSTVSVAYSNLHQNKSFILSLGTQEPRKNQQRLIEAYGNLPAELREQFKLIIVGKKGWGNVNLQAFVQEKNLDNFVLIYDYLPEEIVSYLLQAAYCLAFPSLYEGFGLPLVEAMAMGTPVITSNIGAMAEIVQDAAYLIDPYSVDSIREGLQTLLESPSIRQKLKEKGLERGRFFVWGDAAEQFNKILHKLI
jgi:glycosyltransferase involved in cell wall biosynthesis